MPHIMACLSFRQTRPKWQDGLSSIERLALTVVADAENHVRSDGFKHSPTIAPGRY